MNTKEGEFRPETQSRKALVENLIQDQMGKTITHVSLGLHGDRGVLNALLESRFGWNQQTKEAIWRKIAEKLAEKIRDFPGILKSLTQETLQEVPISAIMVPSLYWRRTTINGDGSFPIYSHLLGTVNVTSQDFAKAEQLLLQFYEQTKLQLPIKADRDREQHILSTIKKYEAGNKPTPDEILKSRDLKSGGSITEPVLQMGTPEEGMTDEVGSISEPARIAIDLSEITAIEFQGRCFQEIMVAIAEPNILERGRRLANRYYRFISSICEQQPEIRAAILKFGEGRSSAAEFARDMAYKDKALTMYADLEWQRKDEAIELAQELQGIFTDRIAYWNKLHEKVK